MQLFPRGAGIHGIPLPEAGECINDVVFDSYGTRLAVCTNSCILIYGAQEDWPQLARIDGAHYDAIWRLSWSHSQRGDLLVSCSEDRQVIVWTEQGFAWKKCFQKTLGAPVLDVRFASPALGIKFAAITAESQVSVFECTTPTTLQCWESQDVMIQGKGKPGAVDWKPVMPLASKQDRLEVLAIGLHDRLVIAAKGARWVEQAYQELKNDSAIQDVAWCPKTCRSYEMVATCGLGVQLWRLDQSKDRSPWRLELLQDLPLPDNKALVWRCSWNAMGSTLAACPENSEVCLWTSVGKEFKLNS